MPLFINNFLGGTPFLELEGTPAKIAPSTELIQRPGYGAALWLTGALGKPFTLRSKSDALNIAHAYTMFAVYKATIGSLVDLIWQGIPFTSPDVRMGVLDVIEVPGGIKPMSHVVGGLYPPGYGWVEADWRLIFLETPSP